MNIDRTAQVMAFAIALVTAFGGCATGAPQEPPVWQRQVTRRQFGMSVATLGETPVDLTEIVQKPTIVEVFPGRDSEARAEVHSNGAREVAVRTAEALYRAIVATGQLLGVPVRGVMVMHLVSLPQLPKSYRFSVTYTENDEGLNYLFETAHVYREGEDPLAGSGVSGLRSVVFNSFPHELTHRLLERNFSYPPSPLGAGKTSPTNAPRWLDDGLAEFVAKRVQASLAPELPLARSEEAGRLVLHDLGAEFLEWPEAGHCDANWRGFPVGDLYAAALVLVETLLDGDPGKLRLLLHRLPEAPFRDHEDLRRFLQDELKRDPNELVKRF